VNDSRLALLGRSVEQIVLALYGILLFSLFVTSLALVPITIGIPLTLGCRASPLALFLGGFLYLGYPLLWSVTPPDVFATPFGVFTVDTLAKSCAVMPLGVVAFGLWAATRPLMTAAAQLAEVLLAPRGGRPSAHQLPALAAGEPSDPRALAVRADPSGGKV
jgi:hypothetical protein